jgi:hypothetical protein
LFPERSTAAWVHQTGPKVTASNAAHITSAAATACQLASWPLT